MPWPPKNTVVVPIDFSESSADAVATAVQLAAQPAGVHVIHVLLPLDYMSPGMVFEAASEDQRKAATEKHLAEFLESHGQIGVNSHVLLGDPGLEITHFASSTKADLIVMPSHGYHGVKRFLLGSVAERVLRHADCPVLVLRRRDAK
jgi:nucleotide-binding universal stress UspA family protein